MTAHAPGEAVTATTDYPDVVRQDVARQDVGVRPFGPPTTAVPSGPPTAAPFGPFAPSEPLAAGPVAPPMPTAPVAPPTPTSRWRRLLAGNESDPRWVRPSLLALLLGTAVLYIGGLGASGWANSFYSAAVQAGSVSWKAFFFGSSDASNFITVDKPPASLWVMEISARMFGVNAWSILVPQALEGVAAVGVLYLAVRRWFTPAAGLLAGAVLALTPVATLMFRYNNPDALLVLLMVLGAYAVTRATEQGSRRWLVAAAVFVGFAFLTKSLQAFLVVPAFALVYLVAAPVSLRRRLVDLALAGVALLVSAGWWVAIVELWPASSRPYIGGSTDNSVLQLIFGYNGFGRLTGNETGSVIGGGATPAAGSWGPTGLSRMFSSSFGGQIAWLIPAALLLGAAALWFTRRAPRTDRRRAAVLLWGGWLLVTGIVFSYAQGIIHQYYTVALAPAVGALVGIGAVLLWRERQTWWARAVLAATLALTSVWSFTLLARSPSWYPGLRVLVLLVGLVAAAALLLVGRMSARVGVLVALVGVVTAMVGPAAFSLQTASVTHRGAIPTAGPTAVGAGFGRPGGFAAGGGGRNFLGGQGRGGQGFGGGQGLTGQVPGRGFGGQLPGQGFGGGQFPGLTGRGGVGGLGGLLNGSAPNAALTAALKADAHQYTWVAATVGSNSAAGFQLASGEPVMAIGGFNGTDPAPSLATFEKYVAAGKIHYFIPGGAGGGGRAGGSSDASEISAWVQQNFTATSIGGATVYDLTQSASSGSTVGSATNTV